MQGLDDLRSIAEELVTTATGRPEAERARILLERLASGRFLVAVVGEFKRGKSTLVNALVAEDVVPTGALPLTAVATDISFGEPEVVVEFSDGVSTSVDRLQVGDYVTEAGNPANRRKVARVEIRGPWPLLEPGVVLVDTPGLGSLYQHNTEVGRVALLDADAAVMVLSADSPLSEQERELLGVLAGRRSPTFLVLNKADHLTDSELAEVRRFVEEVLSDLFGRSVSLFAVDARTALAARLAGEHLVGKGGIEFDAFVSEFSRFITDDLVGARLSATRAELRRLGASLRDAIQVEEAAPNADVRRLDQLVEQFAHEASWQRQGFEDDRTLLRRDVDRLVAEVGERLADYARASPAELPGPLALIVSTAPRDRLVEDLRDAVEEAVRSSFQAFRRAEPARVEERWERIAEAFRARTEQRVDGARQAAVSLFDVPLPHLVIPTLSDQTEHFSFLFLHVGSTTEDVSRALGRLLPSRLARRRALAKARDNLAIEFDRHAGRTRWDLAQRLDALRIDLETTMRAELDRSIDALGEAAKRAQEWHRSANDERRCRVDEARRIHAVATELAALGTGLQ